MKPKILRIAVPLVFTGALALCLCVAAQQTAESNAHRLQAYDLRREVFLLGTVVKYPTASAVPPMGAHLIVQSSSGPVDVHLGNAKVLLANILELQPADNDRIIMMDCALDCCTVFASS